MNRADAYAILSRELDSWRQRPYEHLLALVGRPPSSEIVLLGTEDITVSVKVRWADAEKNLLRIEASADGPSCWRLERLEESIIVGRNQHGG